jgi:hypothetical protein
MLDYLIDCKPPLVFQYFLEALVLTGNSSIADALEPNYTISDACRRLIELERLSYANHISNYNNHVIFNLNGNINSSCNTEQQNNNGDQNLPFPVACTQKNSVPDAGNQYGLLYSEPPIKRLLKNNFNYSSPMFFNSRLSYTSNLSSLTNSRSNSSSMSPINGRSRSSSVNAPINSLKFENRNGLYSNAKFKAFNTNSFDESIAHNLVLSPSNSSGMSKPVIVSDQHTLSSQPPATYNIDWSDVNNLDLDFIVYQSWPDLKKQLAPNECYQMEQIPRGVCLIINNENFFENGNKIEELRRYGTDMDASRLKNLFEKLNFRVDVFVDLRENEMRQYINNFANDTNLNAESYDAICLIILTHGSDGYVHGVDLENKINIDSILNLFDDVLIGKPKLFIFQACRGEYLNQKDMHLLNTSNNQKTSKSSSNFNLEIIEKKSELTSKDSATEVLSDSQAVVSSKMVSINNELEEAVKNFKQIKISSTNIQNTKEFIFKKNMNKSNKSIKMNFESESEKHCQKQTSSNKKSRSRSHSRGKYTNYLASAATAIISAIKTSPNSTKSLLSSISTQTSVENHVSNDNTHSTNGICYENSNIYTSNTYNQSLMNFIDGRPIKTSLPSRSDFFIWYSSVRGFVSHREPDGSPFIKCLVTVFSRCAYELELIEMVRKVNLLMQQYEKQHRDERNSIAYYFMVPVAEFHLTKRLYFNP